MRLRPIFPIAALGLLLAPHASAILDINGNGLSDLWERQYNNQQLLPLEFDPQADPDFDGWTNAQEAAAGTDPFNGITGILRPDVSHTPAFHTDGDGDGIPETLTPATLHLSWPSTAGKQYTLLHSTHPGEHGQALEAPFIGNGNQTTYHIPATGSTGNFWRVATTDTDTDEDGLTNAEEHQLGSNANAKDSDGDGLNDHEEASQYLSPTSSDTDGDGLSDLDDAVGGDPLIDWEKAPESQFVLVDVDIPAGQIAQDLNDQGQVLTQDGIWSGGLWSPISTPNTHGSFTAGGQAQLYEVSYGPSFQFNASGRMIGYTQVQFTAGQAAGGDILATAGSYGNGASASHLAEAIPYDFQNVISLHPLGISNDGTTFCRNSYMQSTGPGAWLEWTRIAVQGGANGQISFIHAPNGFQFTPSPPWSNTSVSRSGALALNTVSTLQNNGPKTYQLAFWDSARQLKDLPTGGSGYFHPIHLTDLPNGEPALCAMQEGLNPKVWLEDENGNLAESGTLSASGIQMFAGNGTGITPDLKLWRNGRLIPLRDLCSAYGDLLDAAWSMHPLKSNKHGVYLVQAEGPNGEQTTKLVVPFDLKDNLTATGVDDVSRTADKTDPGWQEDFWIMAPSGKTAAVPPATQGDDCENDTHFFIPLQGGYTHFRITPEDCSITSQNPFPLSAQDNKNFSTWPLVTWHGTTATTTEPDTSGFWSIGNSGSSSWQDSKLPVNIKVMKKRTVKVAVWLVPLLKSDGSEKPPTIKPQKTELEEYLNQVFSPQINVEFDCVVTETSAIPFDTADGSSFGAPASSLLAGNGYLDTNNAGIAEVFTILDYFNDDNASINVYIVGGIVGVRLHTWSNENQKLYSSAYADGHANINKRFCILASPILGGDAIQIKDTIAHEIGHVILGEGHPDEAIRETLPGGQSNWINGGVAPLRGTDPVIRLMCSGKKRDKTGNSRLLVKNEWDAAEEWLSKETNQGRMHE